MELRKLAQVEHGVLRLLELRLHTLAGVVLNLLVVIHQDQAMQDQALQLQQQLPQAMVDTVHPQEVMDLQEVQQVLHPLHLPTEVMVPLEAPLPPLRTVITPWVGIMVKTLRVTDLHAERMIHTDLHTLQRPHQELRERTVLLWRPQEQPAHIILTGDKRLKDILPRTPVFTAVQLA